MKQFALVFAIILTSSVLLAGVTRILATAVPADPDSLAALLVRYSEQHDAVWCWREICPDSTTMETAFNTAQVFSYFDANLYSIRWSESEADSGWTIAAEAVKLSPQIVRRIKFILPEGRRFSLGEAILIYGHPQQVFYFRDPVAGLYWMSVCFDGGVCVEVSHEIRRLTPRLEVFAIFYRGETVMAERTETDGEELVQRWRGFRSRLI